MTTALPKRLIEVDLPIARISAHVRREKSIRHGHIATLHIWWNRGFDLISRRPHPEDAKTFIEVRFIEVKGRAGIGVVALSENEYRTAQRLKGDYWLYTVFNCAGRPELHAVQDPARLGWRPVVTVEHYQVGPDEVLRAERNP
jgi:hypothetical protein